MAGRLQTVIPTIVAAGMAIYRFLATAGRGELSQRRRRLMGLNAAHTDPDICAAIDAVEKVFVRDFSWRLRRVSYPHESGLDARVEMLEDGWSTGRFLPMRLGLASSARDDSGNYLHQVERRCLDYWASHSLSVCVFLFDPERGDVLWQWVQREPYDKFGDKFGQEQLLAIPASNILDASARLGFEETVSSDPQKLLRSAFAVDRALMERIGNQTAIFIWDEWGDSSPIFGNLRIILDEGEPEMRIDYRIRAHNLHELMIQLFPWACYSYAEPIKEYSNEIAVHVLEVEVRPEALAYLEAEEFLEAGYPEEPDPPSPETDDHIPPEEEAAFWRSRRVPRGSKRREN